MMIYIMKLTAYNPVLFRIYFKTEYTHCSNYFPIFCELSDSMSLWVLVMKITYLARFCESASLLIRLWFPKVWLCFQIVWPCFWILQLWFLTVWLWFLKVWLCIWIVCRYSDYESGKSDSQTVWKSAYDSRQSDYDSRMSDHAFQKSDYDSGQSKSIE